MFIEKIQHLFGTSRVQSLLLEVFAIFLGITASFAVEEWREDREQSENVERYLEAIYYDALREDSFLQRSVYRNNQTVAALNRLLKEDIERIPDEELMALVGQVLRVWAMTSSGGSYGALVNSRSSTPFDNTLQVLHASFEMNQLMRSQLDGIFEEHNRAVIAVRTRYARVANPVMVIAEEDGTVRTGNRFEQPAYAAIRPLFFEDGEFVPYRESIEKVREGLGDAEILQFLNEELERVMQVTDQFLALIQTSRNTRAAIRARLPDIRLAVRNLVLVGDGTSAGWTVERGLPLEREQEGGDWWSADVELLEGSVKFVANGIWGTSWGAPIPWDQVDALTSETAYLGNPEDVFPRGVAAFDLQNIPVRPGFYRVRFNTSTFEYAFESIGGRDGS